MEASTELCRQCAADAKVVLQHLVIAVLVFTNRGDITAESTPELFVVVKGLAGPLKLSEAELKIFIDQGIKYMDEIIIPNSILSKIK